MSFDRIGTTDDDHDDATEKNARSPHSTAWITRDGAIIGELIRFMNHSRARTLATAAVTIISSLLVLSSHWRTIFRVPVALAFQVPPKEVQLVFRQERVRRARTTYRRILPSTSVAYNYHRQFRSASSSEEGDWLKWERMYHGNIDSRDRSSQDVKETGGSYPNTGALSQVRVVSFDLDNTLWKTTPTIASANDALAQFLESRHSFTPPKRVEVVMGELFQSNRSKYCPIEEEDGKSPVLLTQLRKDAIEHVLIQSNRFTSVEATTLTDEAFNAWVQARHEAISSHLAESASTCFDQISNLRTQEGHRILIGAITDGNSDPTLIEELGSYFDFCVNAERVGVSKPDPRVYLEAVTEVLSHPNLQVVAQSDKRAEEQVGPWWVHIGDDFIKDVVAAKGLSMRTIWCRELVLPELAKNEPKLEKVISNSSRTVEELVKQVSEVKVVRMLVGSEDYLADSFHREFADAIVDRFVDVGKLLHDWHSEAIDSLDQSSSQSHNEQFQPSSPMSIVTKDTEQPAEATSTTGNGVDSQATKFCIHCGEKLPLAASFCSSCGQKQS